MPKWRKFNMKDAVLSYPMAHSSACQPICM